MGVVVREARGVEDDDEDEEEEDGINGRGKDKEKEGNADKIDIRVPEKAVTEAAKVVKGALETKVELEAEGKGFWD